MKKFTARAALTAAAVVAPALALFAGAVPAQAATGFAAHYAAPYLELSGDSAKDLAADQKATGLKDYTLAFLIPKGKSSCTPVWEDGDYPMAAFTKQVDALESAGGQAIVSFGGASGGELAQSCGSVSQLTAAYASVVKTYRLNRLDFDIEGRTLDDTAADKRRDQALAALQRSDRSLQIDFTLPVDPDGMEHDAVSLLSGAKAAGVKVNLVNIMTMDFGNGQNPLKDAESGARAAEAQLAKVYGGSAAQNWARLGLTPIAGRNDDREDFTQADAVTLEKFAAGYGVQELSFWEIDSYDKHDGYAYSRIFKKI
jgi:chitinase